MIRLLLLAAANCNAAFVDVWSRGYPIWQSDVFERETGIRIDPTYKDRDVLPLPPTVVASSPVWTSPTQLPKY